MNLSCHFVQDRTVYPILIQNNGKRYLTLYYYTDRSDSVLHSHTNQIVCFPSEEDMKAFCQSKGLQMEHEIWEYDFDAPIDNPVDYSRILNNWNLLNTIADIFGMFFEGDCRKYNSLYDLLFRLNTPAKPIPPTYRLREKDYRSVLNVFRKKDRFLDRFALYQQ